MAQLPQDRRTRRVMLGVCVDCGDLVVFRPYNPSEPPRICMECMMLKVEVEAAKEATKQ